MKELRVSRRIGDIVGALIFIGVAVGCLIVTLGFLPPVLSGDPGAAFFPRLIVGVIFLFSVILLVQRLRQRPLGGADDPDTRAVEIDLSAFGVTVGSVLALVAAMDLIGFEPAAFGFLFLLLGWRTGRWIWAGVTSAIAVALLYLTFVALLKVQLPMLLLPKYIYF